MKKKTSIILYVTYSILLVLIISFADGVGKWVTDGFKKLVFKNDITDVILDIDTDVALEAKGKYEFTYTALGKFAGNPGIKFESSNEDVLTIITGSKPYISTREKFEGDEIDVDVTITSRVDEQFKKTVTFRVKKIYPEYDTFETSYYVQGCGYNHPVVGVGVVIYPYSHVTDKRYTNEFEIIYDSEYLRYDEATGAYIAIKQTPEDVKTCFTVRYPNGNTADTKSFSIASDEGIEFFDEIRVSGESVNEISINKGSGLAPILYKDGKRIMSAVDISYTNPENVSILKNGAYAFDDVGDYTFTFTLPNGFSRTLLVHVRNVIKLPVAKGDAYIDGNKITVPNSEEAVKIELEYPDDITYYNATLEYEGNAARVTESWKCFYIYPKNQGEVTVKLVWDDGYDRLEDTYVIEVVKDTDIVARVIVAIKFFVSKIMGHATLFAVLAVFTVMMFKHITLDKKWLRAILYFSSVLPTAVSTEVIQSFLPHRFAKFTDVLIDISGFLFGTGVCVLIILSKRRKMSSTASLSESSQLDGDDVQLKRDEIPSAEINTDIGENN